jgi:hypothetical protein
LKIYLSGYIGGPKVIDKCVAWRRQIVDFYNNYKGKKYPLLWMDPLNGKDFSSLDENGLKSNIPSHAIIHRDFQCIVRSDLVIVNMDTFGESRPLIGTIAEIAWAWDRRIPIVMITDEAIYKEHPFTAYFASHVVSSVEELLEKKIVNFYFKGWNDAWYGETNSQVKY